MCKKFRELKANEIDVRIGRVIATSKWQGVSLLLYKNARVDMDILDEVVGCTNWQRKHEVINENLYCSVGIWSDEKKEWVWKSDCGTESNTEKEKGEASDAFKRACVNWGIGRELYTAPKDLLVACELDEKGQKPKDKKLKFFVSDIGYENGRISKLIISDQNGTELYKYPTSIKTPQNKAKNEAKTDDNGKTFVPITREEIMRKYGVKNVQETIVWFEGKFGVEFANWGEDETEMARLKLEERKQKREAEEQRKKGMQRIDDADLPFSMRD